MSEEKKKEILEQEKDLGADELNAVAGGDPCVCIVGGGGEASSYHRACSCATRFRIFLLLAQAFTWVESINICSVSTRWNFIHSSSILEKICSKRSVSLKRRV